MNSMELVAIKAVWGGGGWVQVSTRNMRRSLYLCMQGEASAVRYLFRKGLEVNHRSRYVYLSWGLFEADMGKEGNARELFRRGNALNPQDPAILQVRQAHLFR
jgi:hypothetical protein